MKRFKHWLLQLGIAVDQLINVACSPLSLEAWADETVSSRHGRLGHKRAYKWRKVVIDAIWQHIFRLGPNHCENAHAKELTRYQFPPSMRGNSKEPQA